LSSGSGNSGSLPGNGVLFHNRIMEESATIPADALAMCAQIACVIRRIASPHGGICLDTANSLGRPELLETVVEHLADLAVVLHAKDYDIRRVDTRMGF
jgi:hypothetical protein